MAHAKDQFTKAEGVGRMNIALDDLVVHQPVDDVSALPIRRAKDSGVPQQVALVPEGVDADALALAEVLVRVVGVKESARTSNFWPSLEVCKRSRERRERLGTSKRPVSCKTRSLAAWRPSTEKYQFTVCSNSASLMGWEMRIILRRPTMQPIPITAAKIVGSEGRRR